MYIIDVREQMALARYNGSDVSAGVVEAWMGRLLLAGQLLQQERKEALARESEMSTTLLAVRRLVTPEPSRTYDEEEEEA